MKENDENPNHIELLRQALLFYADENNYHGAMGNAALIEMDKGSQARFALTNLDKLKDYDNKMEADYLKNMDEAIKNEDSPENVLKIIEGFKKIASGD